MSCRCKGPGITFVILEISEGIEIDFGCLLRLITGSQDVSEPLYCWCMMRVMVEKTTAYLLRFHNSIPTP